MIKNRDGNITSAHGNDGSIRCAIYGRFSSDQQRKASIDDQLRNCREFAEENGCVVIEDYVLSDEEKTGTTLHGRKALQSLIQVSKTKPKPFDYILIDDTSRFGRNAGDVYKTLDILEHHDVHLFFVSDGLDSGNEWFKDAYASKVRADEDHSKKLGQKVKRGRRGRFLAGLNPGGGCYGYKTVPIYDLSRKGNNGMLAIIGYKQVIDPEQAEVVLRIFQAYSEGMSLGRITKMLNDENIPPSQSSRTRIKRIWNKSAIVCILKNARYCGHLRYGCTRQVRNPETGRMEVRHIPQNEWDTSEQPELRIVSDDLWNRAQEQRVRANKAGVKRLGGMSRTPASLTYLLSGLMQCGLCDGNIVMTSYPKRYGCSNYRNRGTCSNKFTIPQEELEQTFIDKLCENLKSEDLREELIQGLMVHLRTKKSRVLEEKQSAELERGELEENKKVLIRRKDNLVKAVSECGGSRALYEELTQVEERLDRIEARLASTSKAAAPEINEEDVREFVNSRAHLFQQLLLGNPEVVKQAMQRMVSKIVLTPILDERGFVYRVSGDVDLFAIPIDALQSNPVNPIGLQYNIPISVDVESYTKRRPWGIPKAA